MLYILCIDVKNVPMFSPDDDRSAPLYERYSIELLGADDAPAPDGQPGDGMTLHTTRGDVIVHPAPACR